MDSFRFQQYVKILSGILLNPKQYYENLSEEKSMLKPLYVLLISGFIFSTASVISGMSEKPILMGAIFLTNAVGMVFITSALGFGLVSFVRTKPVSYSKIFSIYAYASAAILVLAWMPFMFWISEIWRWWLIGCGLVKGCGVTIKGAVLIISLSFVILMGLFHYAVPFVMVK